MRKVNLVTFVLTFSFAIFPIVIVHDFSQAGFFYISAAAALLMYIFASYKYHQLKREKYVSDRLIYILIFLCFANVILFGLYLGVWENPGILAAHFIGVLVCALLFFTIPPVLYLCLTLGAVIIFIINVILFKTPSVWTYDILHALFAGVISLIIGWEINMNRVSMASIVSKLEAENTTDALTQLKNRRDFMHTFERFISNCRQSDNFLCLAILDIDFFKKYNDHYGHPQGDECLRAVGKALKDFHQSMNIYAARIGGEEFALLWFEKEAANVHDIASQVNKMICGLNIPHEKSEAAPYVTVSIGVHIAQCGVSLDMDALYDLADKALYTAKMNGRNRAVISS